ncbi:MAG: hypothetical protein JHC93_02870 [Parachlamydiales bacterium]|nr:hypothetical protein [Parachlamydiales bacterium]
MDYNIGNSYYRLVSKPVWTKTYFPNYETLEQGALLLLDRLGQFHHLFKRHNYQKSQALSACGFLSAFQEFCAFSIGRLETEDCQLLQLLCNHLCANASSCEDLIYDLDLVKVCLQELSVPPSEK